MAGREVDGEREEGVIVREGNLEGKVKRLKLDIEMRERKEKRRNMVVRRLEVGEDRKREVVKRLLKKIGAEVLVEEVVRVGGVQGKEIWQVRLGNKEQRKEIMTGKKMLRDRRKIITEDLT